MIQLCSCWVCKFKMKRFMRRKWGTDYLMALGRR